MGLGGGGGGARPEGRPRTEACQRLHHMARDRSTWVLVYQPM